MTADRDLNRRITEIIKPLVPADAEEKVQRAYRQFNQIIREHIRNETGLRLTDGDGRSVGLPIKIVDGFPAGFAKLIDRYQDPVLWRLIVGQPKLARLMDGLKFVISEWSAIEAWAGLPEPARGARLHLDRTWEAGAALQKAAIVEDIRKQLREINEDILGAYIYPPGRTPWIELYWMPIAMTAGMLEVEIADLALVTMAHELAHGYTHQGHDIDSQTWDTAAFRASDLRIKEGLAQFYAQTIADKVAIRAPGMRKAFDEMLKLQSGPYTVHTEWLKDDAATQTKRQPSQRGEIVRFTMIAARSTKGLTYDAWTAMLNATRTRFSASTSEDEVL